MSQQQPYFADQDLPIARMHKDPITQTSDLLFSTTSASELTRLSNQNLNIPDQMDANPTQSMLTTTILNLLQPLDEVSGSNPISKQDDNMNMKTESNGTIDGEPVEFVK
ncbi:22852_t:CDS:2, partial [Gigaspora margarita]